jgi:hypothetical protein
MKYVRAKTNPVTEGIRYRIGYGCPFQRRVIKTRIDPNK